MQKKNFIKSGILVAFLVAISMFGFKAAIGYGGGGGPTLCSSVTYAEWQTCAVGVQYRNVSSQTPVYCQLTASQQLARVRNCNSFPDCTSVTYGNWSSCVFGFQFRNTAGQTPDGCKRTLSQELAKVQTCSGRVLGEKIYADGTLLRGLDKKIYVIVNGKLKPVATLAELRKYAGREIINTSEDLTASYNMGNKVLGTKIYEEGSLLRSPDMKIYVIANGKLKHIVSLTELRKYAGRIINNVDFSVIKNFEIVK